MKLHWSPRSPFVRKVAVAAHELGLAGKLTLQRSRVSMTAPNRALMADHPLSKIPTLVLDDGRCLYDSRVICEYLDALAGAPRLFPAAPGRRWTALRRQALADDFLATMLLWRNERDRPPEKRSDIHLSAFAEKAASGLDALERDAAAFAGDEIDIGHIATACALGYLDFRFPELGWRRKRDRLAVWYAAFSARPSMRATEIVDDG